MNNRVLTPTELRAHIYQVLDEVLATGQPIEIRRRGRIVRLVPAEPVDRLSRLERRDCIVGDPDDLVHVDWSGEWNPFI